MRVRVHLSRGLAGLVNMRGLDGPPKPPRLGDGAAEPRRPSGYVEGLLAAARSSRGIALVMALVVLLSLSALVVAFLTMSALEPLISQNLADATAARTLADSGIELVLDTLATTADW